MFSFLVLFNIFFVFFTNVKDYYFSCKLKNNVKKLNLNKNIKMYYIFI